MVKSKENLPKDTVKFEVHMQWVYSVS